MRLGRKLGRTLYVASPEGDWECDTCIGMVDSRRLAEEIMEAVNAYYGHTEG